MGSKHKVDPFLVDEDTAPLSDDEVARLQSGADVFRDLDVAAPQGRGRPTLEKPKKQVTLRLDADLLETLRASGKGWQSRVNEILRAKLLD